LTCNATRSANQYTCGSTLVEVLFSEEHLFNCIRLSCEFIFLARYICSGNHQGIAWNLHTCCELIDITNKKVLAVNLDWLLTTSDYEDWSAFV